MPTYRVLIGKHRRSDGTRAVAGTDDDLVELPAEQAELFSSQKFEKVESAAEESDTESDTPADVTNTPSDADGEEDVSDTSDNTSDDATASDAVASAIPDDYRTLCKMAAECESDEVNGAMSGDEITAFFETLTVEEVEELKAAVDNE